jgi:hypothetical protein
MKTVNVPPSLKVNIRQLLILAVCVTTCGVAPLAATAPVAAEAAPAQQWLKDLPGLRCRSAHCRRSPWVRAARAGAAIQGCRLRAIGSA